MAMRGVAYREHRFMQELRLRASKAHPPQPRMLDQEEITFWHVAERPWRATTP